MYDSCLFCWKCTLWNGLHKMYLMSSCSTVRFTMIYIFRVFSVIISSGVDATIRFHNYTAPVGTNTARTSVWVFTLLATAFSGFYVAVHYQSNNASLSESRKECWYAIISLRILSVADSSSLPNHIWTVMFFPCFIIKTSKFLLVHFELAVEWLVWSWTLVLHVPDQDRLWRRLWREPLQEKAM